MEMVEANGVVLGVDDRGSGSPVILLHGFPELAYSWRHVTPALVDAGFRSIAFDQRGYGASSKPENVADYRLEALVGDVIGLMDALSIDEAILVGHDWGSIVVYTAAITHPDRCSRVVSLNVPYRGACWGFPPIDFIRENLADRFGYILMFQEEGAAEAGFAADPRRWLDAFYMGGAGGATVHTPEESAVYVEAFTRGGIRGPVNWYRNIDANAAAFGHLQNAPLTQPTLVLAADGDPVLPLSLMEDLDRWAPDLEFRVIADSGHWTQQEQPGAVNTALVEWLTA